MEREGERWHFNAHDWERYSVLDVPLECELTGSMTTKSA